MISSVWKKRHPSLKEQCVSRNLLTNLNSCNNIRWIGTLIIHSSLLQGDYPVWIGHCSLDFILDCNVFQGLSENWEGHIPFEGQEITGNLSFGIKSAQSYLLSISFMQGPKSLAVAFCLQSNTWSLSLFGSYIVNSIHILRSILQA